MNTQMKKVIIISLLQSTSKNYFFYLFNDSYAYLIDRFQ